MCLAGRKLLLYNCQHRQLNQITGTLFDHIYCSYSTIAWVGSLSKGRAPNVSYAYKKTSGIDTMFRVFNALGQVTFAYAGHAVVLEIQATIPSTPEKPSRVPMWKGAVLAYFINAICYFPVAVIGYWAFGQNVADNVLVALERPAWLIAAANLMVVIHVIGSYQVYLQLLWGKQHSDRSNSKGRDLFICRFMQCLCLIY